MCPRVTAVIAAMLCVMTGASYAQEQPPEQRWSGLVQADSVKINKTSPAKCITAPPGWSIDIPSLNPDIENSRCSETYDNGNFLVKLTEQSPSRVCFNVTSHPTVSDQQHCWAELKVGYYLTKQSR